MEAKELKILDTIKAVLKASNMSTLNTVGHAFAFAYIQALQYKNKSVVDIVSNNLKKDFEQYCKDFNIKKI